MFKRIILTTLAAFVMAAGASAVSAQSWVDLGTKEVMDRAEQDTWHIGKGKGEFRKIKLAVIDRAVRFYRLEVKYENGRIEKLEIRNLIPAGGETRAIDLTGNERFIDKVDVWYEASTVRRGRRSHVTLYGMK
ncbi:hypothetical protein BH10ACI2_BH10ACI2_22500 [soil metagenome]